MIYALFALALSLAATLFLWWNEREHRHAVQLELGSMTETATWAVKSGTDMKSEINHLADRLADQEIRHREELRAAAHQKDQQIDSLMRQVQTMAERLAKLKIESPEDARVVDAEPTAFIPEDTAPVPYSQALFDFVSGLATDDARVMVEDYVERMRSTGADDIQILEQLNRGEYVDG